MRTRFVARAIGTRAAAPALVRQAAAVTPTDRRSGITMPSAPNAAADRTIAPRLRGSVSPSIATSSPAADFSARSSRSSGWL